MRVVNTFLAGSFGAVLLYILVTNANGAGQVLTSLGDFNRKTFGTLMGKTAY
jgi:hypothetical protein